MPEKYANDLQCNIFLKNSNQFDFDTMMSVFNTKVCRPRLTIQMSE